MERAIDLTGQKFGRLTVIRRNGTGKSGNALWECVCDCGNIKTIAGKSLRSGSSKSCGCLQKEIVSAMGENLAGKKFGRLTVIEKSEKRKNKIIWICKCDCGEIVSVPGESLKSGNTKSCGCYKSYVIANRNRTHNKTSTRIYTIWRAAKQRCYYEKDKRYRDYGGRGITICDEWLHNFQAFYDWAMANGYRDDLTIERKDVNGNYEPGNCEWITRERQANNKRNSRVIEYDGEQHTLSEWSRITGINHKTILYRYNHGLPLFERRNLNVSKYKEIIHK